MHPNNSVQNGQSLSRELMSSIRISAIISYTLSYFDTSRFYIINIASHCTNEQTLFTTFYVCFTSDGQCKKDITLFMLSCQSVGLRIRGGGGRVRLYHASADNVTTQDVNRSISVATPRCTIYTLR